MTTTALARTRAHSVVAIVAAALIFVCFGSTIWHAFASSVGWEGLLRGGVLGLGFAGMGVGMLLIAVILLADAWRKRPHGKQTRSAWFAVSARQLGIVALNALCYVGPVFLALGALTVADQVIFAALGCIALAVAVFTLYRRHRKRHPASYDHVKPWALILFCIAIALFMLIAGADSGSRFASDALHGPRTASGALIDVQEERPSGRHRWLDDHAFALTYRLDSGESITVRVKVEDREALQSVVDAGPVARITWYPESGVLASVS